MLRRVIAGIGRSLITVGVLLLLFVAFQLWGTGIEFQSKQNDAKKAFAAQLEATGQELSDDAFAGFEDDDLGLSEELVGSERAMPQITTLTTTSLAPTPVATPVKGKAAASPTTTKAATTTTPPVTKPLAPATKPTPTLPKLRPGRSRMQRPKSGTELGRLVIPAIRRADVLVEGSNVELLKSGPGHYKSTPLPGEVGNVGIAGHRTTFGGPFFNLDRLKNGDPIFIQTIYGKFRYEVFRQFIVGPKDRTALAPVVDDSILTLTTCHPKYTAEKRLIVQARLVGEAIDTDFIFEPEPVVTTIATTAPTTVAPTTTAEPLAFDTAAVVVETSVEPVETTVAPTPIATAVPALATEDPSQSATVASGSLGGSGPIWHFGWFTGQRSWWIASLAWAAVCAAVWVAAWLFARSRKRIARSIIYTSGFVFLFAPALWKCFQNLIHLLPESV